MATPTFHVQTTTSSGSATLTQNVTLPAVSFGDYVAIMVVCLPVTGTTIPVVTSSNTTAGTIVNKRVTQGGSEPLPASVAGTIFDFIASANSSGATDSGGTITFTSTIAGFWAISVASWSNVNTSVPVSIVQGAFGGANTASVTCPTVSSTAPAGSIAVFLGGGAAEGGALTPPAGSTSRSSVVSGADVASVIADTSTLLSPGTPVGGGTFNTSTAPNSILVGFTLILASTPTTHILPVFSSTDGNGTQTWNFTSDINGPGTQQLRILPPSAPSARYQHSFLYMLPVVIGTSTANGDPISVMVSLGANNTYNTTSVVPAYAIDPWYADNPNNAAQQQETFMLQLQVWMAASQFTTGGEKNYLIGFSKSGIGGQGLQFHRPDIWFKTASWDAPFMMTDFDGTDPTFGSTVGGNPANAYGTTGNFQTNYRLSTSNISTWNTAAGNVFTSQVRLWIGGYFSFQADVAAYKSQLTSQGIGHVEWNVLDAAHAWENDWVANALSFMFSTSGSLLVATSII